MAKIYIKVEMTKRFLKQKRLTLGKVSASNDIDIRLYES
jgi:hypothetical protein